MCGIAGIFSNSEIDLRRRGIEKMTDSMVHRGPDGFGYYHDHVLSFGHRRLAIIDLSEGGHQPQQDAEGKVVITFNGEIFNYQELKKELHPYPFKSKSDTEVIIAAYLRWGYDFVKRSKDSLH